MFGLNPNFQTLKGKILAGDGIPSLNIVYASILRADLTSLAPPSIPSNEILPCYPWLTEVEAICLELGEGQWRGFDTPYKCTHWQDESQLLINVGKNLRSLLGIMSWSLWMRHQWDLQLEIIIPNFLVKLQTVC